MGKFALDLTKMVDKTKSKIDTVVQKATFDIFKSVILKSPVRSGRFRGNWIASAGGYGSTTVDTADKAGTTTINAMSGVALGTKAGGVTYLVNNLPYSIRLELGYSNQAPHGMIRTTVLEYQQYVKNASMVA